MNVHEYAKQQVGLTLKDGFKELPVESVCGEACKAAIDGYRATVDCQEPILPLIERRHMQSALIRALEVLYFG